MLADLLKSETFNIAFSLLLGIGLWAVLRPTCTSDSCAKIKAPPIKEFDGNTFRLGDTCYKFKAKTKECPKEGYIEPFNQNSLKSSANRLANLQTNGTTYSFSAFDMRD